MHDLNSIFNLISCLGTVFKLQLWVNTKRKIIQGEENRALSVGLLRWLEYVGKVEWNKGTGHFKGQPWGPLASWAEYQAVLEKSRKRGSSLIPGYNTSYFIIKISYSKLEKVLNNYRLNESLDISVFSSPFPFRLFFHCKYVSCYI